MVSKFQKVLDIKDLIFTDILAVTIDSNPDSYLIILKLLNNITKIQVLNTY
jgi:hypothetical protein